MHIVEIRRDGDDLAGPAAQMRTFLDGIGIQPSMFRVSLVPGGPPLSGRIYCFAAGGSVRAGL